MDAMKTEVPFRFATLDFRHRCRHRINSLGFGNVTNFLAFAFVSAVFFTVGCGKSDSPTEAKAVQVPETAPTSPTETAPTEVVSQFLDQMRRGGEDSQAMEFLTKLAQQEMTRIGRPLMLPGSPDTVFDVRQALPVPQREDTVWVHTFLKEPGEGGQSVQYEVVWTVQKKSQGWRISGFVLDQGDGLEPLEFDFENGDKMAALLAELDPPGDQTQLR